MLLFLNPFPIQEKALDLHSHVNIQFKQLLQHFKLGNSNADFLKRITA